MPVTLHGYRYSVYHRIARVALHEKGVPHTVEEIDPFADPDAARRLHPFARVPILTHDGFALYETTAITAYVDAAFDGPPLTPADPRAAARVAQVVAAVDAYAYRPLVRQVFAHRVFRPAVGETPDEAEVAEGLAAARPVLAALEAVAAEALVLDGRRFTRADAHLAPMLAYFAAAPEGATHLADHPALGAWFAWVARRPSLSDTDPGLPRR